MKTIVIKIAVDCLTAGTGTDGKRMVLTNEHIIEHQRTVWPENKKLFYQLMKEKYLPAGGFIYGGDLYRFEQKMDNPYTFCLYAYVTFEDTNNEGKSKFMSRINRTGLLQTDYAEIYKNYS